MRTEPICAGLRFEYELVEKLQEEDWACATVLGSRGPFDVIAMNIHETRFIQVKSTRRPEKDYTIWHWVNAVERLRELAIPPSASLWLYTWIIPETRWIAYRVSDWSDDRVMTYSLLKKELQHA